MHQIFNEYIEAILALYDVGMTTSKLAAWAVSHFSLQSYCTRNLSTRAAKPQAEPQETRASQSLIVIITSWFAIALDEIRTRRILREKVD